ncbi:MAG: hypothetical protein IT379_29085 [Deltaproteobacteria bacterium]|nr:hypothetical protein [Deltaproteobacteria bacterium]
MPDTTLHGYRLEDQLATRASSTLFGYPAPAIEALEPNRATAPAPAMDMTFESLAPIAAEPPLPASAELLMPTVSELPLPAAPAQLVMPPLAELPLPAAPAQLAMPTPSELPLPASAAPEGAAIVVPAPAPGPLPVAVISDAEHASAALEWSEGPSAAGPVDVWTDSKDARGDADDGAFEDEDPAPPRRAASRSAAPIAWVGAGLAAVVGVAGVAAALFLFSGDSVAPEARMTRARPRTAVATAPVAPAPAEAPVAVAVPAAEPTAPAATPAVTPVRPAAVRNATAPRAASSTATASAPRRARRASSSTPSLDDAPMAPEGTGPSVPSFDLGNALAPLMGGAAPAAAPTGPVAQADDSLGPDDEGDDSLAGLGERATAMGSRAEPAPSVSAPPPMAPAPRPGDEVDWNVPFGG